MPRLFLRFACTFFSAFQVMTAQALIELPGECQGADFNLACEPGYRPHDGEIGLLVRNAILQKLIIKHPKAAVPLPNSDFLQDWTEAWTSFQVPAAVEAVIGGLSAHDFGRWIELLCSNLPTDVNAKSPINFAAMPMLVVSSAPPVAGTAVPLPTSLWLFASAILGVAVGGKHRKR